MFNFAFKNVSNRAPTGATDSIQWHPITSDKPCYLHIDEKIEMKSGRINENRIAFWNSLTQKARLRNNLQYKL